MLAKKNRAGLGAVLFAAFAVLMAGCSPSGPRALHKGQKLLNAGDYGGALAQFKIATSLLATNAQAWNYLGVACQHAGQLEDAAAAYQRALILDRGLVEAHYNLGTLWLEQNKPAAAVTEFTAYTLRRGHEPEGWLKLGSAQLHARDFLAAEKSFSIALTLSNNSAEALNGLGLARVGRGRPRDATEYFSEAIQHHPEFAPAYLNLATVAQESLHDTRFALQNYRAYLELTPRPPDWDAVNGIVESLEHSQSVARSTPQAETRNAAATPPRLEPAQKPAQLPRANPPPKPKPSVQRPSQRQSSQPEIAPPAQEVKVQPSPEIASGARNAQSPTVAPPARSQTEETYVQNGVTPLPRLNPTGPGGSDRNAYLPAQPSPPAFPRYLYRSPEKPSTGDRRAASAAFTRADEFEQSSRLTDALEWFRRAKQLDPSWFEAQYNYAVLAYRLRNYSAALPAYETALAIRPDSVDTRYYFAVALKAAGYVTDSVNELKKIVAVHPDDVRTQLTLGNLYAQQLHDPVQARRYYLKVLELDPHNAQATDIRFWLSSNPE